MKKRRRILALLLSAVMVFALFGGITTLADEPEDTGYQAASAGENTVYIESDGYTFLSFTPDESGYYQIYSTGTDDTYAELYDSSFNIIEYDNDSGEELNFRVSGYLEAGTTYYISVGFFESSSGTVTFYIETYDPYSGVCGDNLTYSFEDGTLTISGTGSMYKHYDYSTDDFPWYDFCDEITAVVIEDGVTDIPYLAFGYYYDNLESVVIGNDVTEIGRYSFINCESLSSVTIGNSVEDIGTYAFYNNISLTEVVIPDSVTNIGEFAFRQCENLTDLTIGSAVTSIAYGAFRDCESLTEVSIPSSVTSIEGNAFGYDSALSIITFEGSAPAIEDNTFTDVTATVYYPASDSSWTSDVMLNYGGTLTWVASESSDTGTSDTGSSSADTSASESSGTDTSDTGSSGTDTSDTGSSGTDAGDDSDTLEIISSETVSSYILGSGGSAVIAVDADIDDFVSVAVGGETLTAGTDYTVTEGSTIITFSEDYLESLDAGTYEVVITFETGTVTTTITIAEAAESPETGDAAVPAAFWMGIAALCAFGLGCMGIRKVTEK